LRRSSGVRGSGGRGMSARAADPGAWGPELTVNSTLS
jgi:hypothetical protein